MPDTEKKPEAPKRKIKLGLIGCGGRGNWIIPHFLRHGGYELYAVADYFQPVADALGDKRGVDKRRRFSGLSGYKRVIESGVEAVALIVPPCFLPEHSAAAAAAGLHVYMAKPVAPDVPGCLAVESAGKQATEKQQVFFVDYQLPTDPGNIQVAKLIRGGGLGKLAKIITVGINGGRPDPPMQTTIENRICKAAWNYTIALSGASACRTTSTPSTPLSGSWAGGPWPRWAHCASAVPIRTATAPTPLRRSSSMKTA